MNRTAAGYGVRVAGEQSQATLFERGSNVLEYWLANAEGFHVVARRKPRHRVDHVVIDRDGGSASMLIVRRKRGRRSRRIPVVQVAAVDPFERLLYLAPRRPVRTAAARSVQWAAPRVVASARSTQRRSVETARRLQPRVVASARSTQRRSVETAGRLQSRVVASARWTRSRSLDLAHRLRPRVVAAARLGFAASRVAAQHGVRAARLAAVRARPLLLEAAVLLRRVGLRMYRTAGLVVGLTEVREQFASLRPVIVAAARRARDRVASAANALRSARSSS